MKTIRARMWRTVMVMAPLVLLVVIALATSGIGSAAAPDPQLSDDLVLFGDGGGNRIGVVDVDAMARVNWVGGGTVIAGNHGIQMDGDGRYVWTANATMSSSTTARIVRFDLGTLAVDKYFDTASGSQYAFNNGFCGIEYNQNNAASGKLWTLSMATNGTGGAYEFDANTGTTGGYVDTSAGADSSDTCGIGWNSGGTVAYSSLMAAKKTNQMGWPGGGITGTTAHSVTLHILDVNKSNGMAYVSAGAANGVGSTMDVVDTSTMTKVGSLALGGYNPHSATLAHNNGFLYAHSRTVSGGNAAAILIMDIGGGGTGSATSPNLIGVIPDNGGAGSCGNDVVSKTDYCSKPALSLSKTGTYWASYADYEAGQLSVDYSVGNGSALAAAHSVAIAGTVNTNGVTMVSATGGGNIPGGGSASATVKYQVPAGVGSFKSTVYATASDLCGNSHTYPGPYPGP